jgi:hypothetical protein
LQVALLEVLGDAVALLARDEGLARRAARHLADKRPTAPTIPLLGCDFHMAGSRYCVHNPEQAERFTV